MHHLRYRQIAQLFAHPHQLIDHFFKLAHGLNLLAIHGNQGGIAQAHRDGLVGLFAGQQRIGAALDVGAVGMLDGQELFGQGAAPQFAQVGELAQEGLALLFQVGVVGERWFSYCSHILLQYMRQKQGKPQNPLLSRPPAPVSGLVLLAAAAHFSVRHKNGDLRCVRYPTHHPRTTEVSGTDFSYSRDRPGKTKVRKRDFSGVLGSWRIGEAV